MIPAILGLGALSLGAQASLINKTQKQDNKQISKKENSEPLKPQTFSMRRGIKALPPPVPTQDLVPVEKKFIVYDPSIKTAISKYMGDQHLANFSPAVNNTMVDLICKNATRYVNFIPSSIAYSLCETALGWLKQKGKTITARSVANKANEIYQKAKIKTAERLTRARATPGSKNTTPLQRLQQQISGVNNPWDYYPSAKLLYVSNKNMALRKKSQQPVMQWRKKQVIEAPVAKSFRRSSVPPRIVKSKRGLTIAHSEMIGSVISSGTTLTYKTQSYTNNPGRFATYPWLSTIAGNFDQYVIKKCVVNFVSNQPTSTAGKVGLGFDYDSSDIAPGDRNEFFALTHHTECAPWDSLSLNVPVDNKPRFINSHTVTDSKLIDLGQIFFMSDQIVALNSNLGDVTIDYVVELLKPQQAIYSTMVMDCGLNSGAVGATSSLWTPVGPIVATMTDQYKASTTIVEFNLPQGYYVVDIGAYDGGGSTPVFTSLLATSTAVGKQQAVSIVNHAKQQLIIKSLSNDCKLRITISGVTNWADLQNLTIAFTRVSAVVCNAMWDRTEKTDMNYY